MKYSVKIFNSERIDKIYYFFACLRIVLTFIPQKGYVHPDEFFQSIEVIAGDVFDIESNRPWEFNQTFPIRSIFVPYVMIGIPYIFLRKFDNLFFSLGLTLKTPYWLIVIPRIHYCLLSFIIDYCLYKICYIHYEKYKGKLILLASSYVVLVYGTHTFSNTIEMILMAILLYLVIDSHIYSYNIIKQDEFLKKKYDESKEANYRARLHKIKTTLPSHTLRNCLFIGFIVTMGIFNRPTFIAFAFPCVFFWIYRGIGYKIVTLTEINVRMLLLLLSCFLFSCLFILVDSSYFGYLSGAELLQMDISFSNFVVTPLNFIRYNVDVNKLSEHGLHPRFLHFLINVPLLYSVLGVLAIGNIIMFCIKLLSGRHRSLPNIYDIRCLMTVAIFFPIVLLSYFPHQEARFLIPITLPIIYTYGDTIINNKFLLKIWWFLNGLCLLFFGFIHQAGVFPLAVHLQNNELQQSQQIHLVTSHMYNIPISLLAQRNSRHLYGTGASKYLLPKSVILHELGSKSSEIIVNNLKVIHHAKSVHKNIRKRNKQILLALPLNKAYELTDYIQSFSVPMYIDQVATFYPHISTEALPVINLSVESTNDVYHFIKFCGLGLYKVYNNETVTLINKNAFI